MSYFIDASGMLEIANGNASYKKYLDQDVVTSAAFVSHVYSVLLQKYNEKIANYFFRIFSDLIVDIPADVIPKAALFKEKNKKKGFSIAQSSGYVYSISEKRLFLTSDSSFKGIEKAVYLK